MDRLLDNFSLSRDSPEGLGLHLVEHTPVPVPLNSTRHALVPPRPVGGHKIQSVSPTFAGQCTSFQNSFFISQASQVNTSRNSTTQIPSERRADWVGSPT